MQDINNLISEIEKDISTIHCTLQNYEAIQAKRYFIEKKLEKLNTLISQIEDKTIRLTKEDNFNLIANQFLLSLGHSYWNYTVKLQTECEEKIARGEEATLEEIIAAKEDILHAFQHSYDTYHQFPTILNAGDKKTVCKHLATSFEDLADSLADKLNYSSSIEINQEKELLIRIMHNYASSLELNYKLQITSKVKAVALSYLNYLYKSWEKTHITRANFLQETSNFINKYQLKAIKWDTQKNREFKKYLNYLSELTEDTKQSPKTSSSRGKRKYSVAFFPHTKETQAPKDATCLTNNP